MKADDAAADESNNLDFQDFENRTIYNSYKMSVSAASSNSIGKDFRVIFWPNLAEISNLAETRSSGRLELRK